MFVGFLAKRDALVYADVVHAERARLFDERDAGVLVAEEETLAVRSELRVALPRRDLPFLRQFVHELHVAGLVGVAAAVQQQTVAAFQPVDHLARGGCLLDGNRLVGPAGRDERQTHQVRVAVQEYVLDEIAGAGAVHVLPAEEGVVLPALGFQRAREIGRQVMSLDVENELPAFQPAGRQLGIEGRFRRQVEGAPPVAGRGVNVVEGQQRRRGAAARGQELAARTPGSASGRGRLLEGVPPGALLLCGQRNGQEFAVGGAVELDGQRCGIMFVGHSKSPGGIHGPPTIANA